MNQGEINKQIFERLEKIEKAIFCNKKQDVIQKGKQKGEQNFKGATGGLRLLISKGFFDKKQTFGAIKGRLAEEDYHYSDQAIPTPLNNLSKSGGPLVGFKEGGKKVYAKRK